MLVAAGKKSIQEVKSQDMYPRMIRGEIIPHDEMAKRNMTLKRAHQKKYKKIDNNRRMVIFLRHLFIYKFIRR